MNFNLLTKRCRLQLVIFAFLCINSISLFAQPDLIVVESALQNSFQVQTLNSDDQCYLNEGCVNGLGQRDIIRFTTHIKNIGNQDFYVGSPPGNPADENEVWEYDECHGHWHYEGYAEYKLFDENNIEIPIGFKNGFCLIDIECSGGGNFTYTCSNQGISAGCGDVYSSGLDCQWIDITDVPDGRYRLELRVNWDQDPDANGNYETSYTNNTGSICFDLERMAGEVSVDVVGNGCDPDVDCSEVTLAITLDNYPEETSWEIRNASGQPVATGGTYGNQPDGSTVTQVICLESGCYDFIINDSYGDGICCGYGNGSYALMDDSGNSLASGGSFTNSETTNFCITTVPPPCTDNDNDGICAADDCDDNNDMVPAPPGASCDDGDPNTDHDEIGADGCTCAGDPIGPHDDCDDISISANGDYIIINGFEIFPHVNIQVFNSNWSLVDNCVDDCGTTYGYGPADEGVYYVSVKTFDENWGYECDLLVDVTVTGGPCPDVDQDGVCAANDCDDNNPNLPTTVGSACNDGNADTENDEIQADGCTCEGTPIGGCTDSDNDGVCEDDDCDDNNPNIPATVGSACDDGNVNTIDDQIQSDGCTCEGTPNGGGGTCDDIIISTSPNSISISQLDFPNINIQIFTSSWSLYFSCVNNCGDPLVLNNVPEGGYIVSVKTFDENWQQVCDLLEDQTVPGGGGCTDADGDGYCAADDCDDNNPSLPATVGSSCNDGNANTENDQIQADGCTCEGTPIGNCTDADNDGVCEENDCNDNDPNLPAPPGSTCSDGDANTINDVILADGCTCEGTPEGEGCDLSYSTGDGSITFSGLNTAHVNLKLFDASFNVVFACIDDCQNPQLVDGLPGGTYYVDVQLFDENWQSVCSVGEYTEVTNSQGFMSNAGSEYLYFMAVRSNDIVNLQWIANTDYRNRHFIIERSENGSEFTQLAQIPSQLLGTAFSTYYRTDDNPFNGTSFYRVKEVFDNETFRYSTVREIKIDSKEKRYNIFPNPTSGHINLDLLSYNGKKAKVYLTNQLGQIVYRQDFERLGRELIEMDFSKLPGGLYFINISIEGQKPIGEKLMIARL